jgi:hypothetical protein
MKCWRDKAGWISLLLFIGLFHIPNLSLGNYIEPLNSGSIIAQLKICRSDDHEFFMR